MNVLVTSARLPYAIELIRKLDRTGHHVHASDTFRSAPGLHSKHTAEGFVTARPTEALARFYDHVEVIVREESIDRILPAFEEVFYLAKHRERFEPPAELFAPPFETLARLHDKVKAAELGEEIGLSMPEKIVARSREELRRATEAIDPYFARPAFSRGGVTLLTNEGPLAGKTPFDECEPTDGNPFLVQPFIEGTDLCTFSIAHHGRLAAHATYLHPLTLEHSGGITFVSVEDDAVLDATRRIVEATDYHGAISIDFLRTRDGLMLVECNPRPTAGVTVMPDEMLDDALMDRHPDRTLVAPGGTRRKLSLGLIQSMLKDGEQIPADLKALFDGGEDVYASRGDLRPLLWQIVAYGHVFGYRMRQRQIKRTDPMQGYFYDITWDGTPID